jgi:tetratricopeptide (TPR) repeat protein
VQYVGDQVCGQCHVSEAHKYRRHPMGRSLAPVARVASSQKYDRTAHNPFEALAFEYRVEPQGDRVVHKEIIRTPDGQAACETAAEVRFVIGSGSHAHSYLIGRDGYLFQSPITWYAQKQSWGLSPGFEQRHERFARAVLPECLFCHCNRADPVEHTLNRYREPIFHGHAIGCERCHGPGELHVKRREAAEPVEGIDETIVNPKHLSPELRDAVCEQCHLEAESRVLRRGRGLYDYRPGLPLELFWAVFVRRPESANDDTVASHIEQMHESRCYQKTGNRMSCLSCHDPHEQRPPAERAAYYRGRCLECHAEKPCSLPAEQRRARDDACAACHMPAAASTDVPHVAVTNHRVPRRGQPHAPHPAPLRLPPGEAPIVPYHRGPAGTDDKGGARDLGVALADVMRRHQGTGSLARLALPLLEQAVEEAPDDLAALEAHALARRHNGQLAEALESYEALLAKAPDREVALTEAAEVAEEVGRVQDAAGYWKRAVAVNPWMPRYRFHLARLLAAGKDWPAAREQCDAVLRFDPANVETRLLLVAYHIDAGDRRRAKEEFDRVLALKPEDPERLRRWFAAKMP